MSELGDVFEKIMSLDRWSGGESRSGPGSTLSYTLNLRAQLERFIETFAIRRFFDAPCGDFHWMKEVRFPPGFAYIGGDIAPSLIAANNELYSGAARKFLDFDIIGDEFPDSDVWFCRDCLFHLPNSGIFEALRNFARSRTGLLMMTNHLNTTGFPNVDVEAGEFRLLDFHSAPFNLPREVLFRVADYIHPYPQREMCVWTREQIVAALDARRA
jgi:SAM-dependent methyltransferase